MSTFTTLLPTALKYPVTGSAEPRIAFRHLVPVRSGGSNLFWRRVDADRCGPFRTQRLAGGRCYQGNLSRRELLRADGGRITLPAFDQTKETKEKARPQGIFWQRGLFVSRRPTGSRQQNRWPVPHKSFNESVIRLTLTLPANLISC